MTKETNIGQVNPFVPLASAHLTPDLVVWQDIRRTYARFPTSESLDRVAALNLVNEELAKEGLVADLLIGGSLAYGQSTDHSDVDVFAIVIPEEGVGIRSIIEDYQDRVSRLMGTDREIRFPVTADIDLISVSDMFQYLDSNSFNHATRSSSIGWASWNLRKFHSCYQTNLRIGDYSLDLIQKVESLKEDLRVVRALDFTHTFWGLARIFRISFLEYQWRLSKHPDFSLLPEQERVQYLEYLEERQRQLLFYIENPQYCR